MRDLFASAKADQDELQSYKVLKVTRFDGAPNSYYGDGAEEGEAGRALLDEEREAEKNGACALSRLALSAPVRHMHVC